MTYMFSFKINIICNVMHVCVNSHSRYCLFLFKINSILLLIIYNALLRTKQTLSYLSLLKSTLRYFKPFYVTKFISHSSCCSFLFKKTFNFIAHCLYIIHC